MLLGTPDLQITPLSALLPPFLVLDSLPTWQEPKLSLFWSVSAYYPASHSLSFHTMGLQSLYVITVALVRMWDQEGCETV